jgi:hypothetical protein
MEQKCIREEGDCWEKQKTYFSSFLLAENVFLSRWVKARQRNNDGGRRRSNEVEAGQRVLMKI